MIDDQLSIASGTFIHSFQNPNKYATLQKHRTHKNKQVSQVQTSKL